MLLSILFTFYLTVLSVALFFIAPNTKMINKLRIKNIVEGCGCVLNWSTLGNIWWHCQYLMALSVLGGTVSIWCHCQYLFIWRQWYRNRSKYGAFVEWILREKTEHSNIYPTRCNVTQFILSGNCSTCFGWYYHPSTGAHTTASTASGICHTLTAICCYCGRVGISDAVEAVVCAPVNEWWYHPKHVE
jgi:hypothetical protein